MRAQKKLQIQENMSMRRPRCQKSCITKNKVYRFRFYPIGRGEHLDLIVPCLYEDPHFSVMSSFEEFRVVLYDDNLRKSVMKSPSQFDEKISSLCCCQNTAQS